MSIKRLSISLISVCILIALTSVPTYADEDAIPSIEITATVSDDGSTAITEIWTVENSYDGTEYYKALYNGEDMSVHSLSVSDETGRVYENVYWDTDLSFEEKAYKCGILETDDGYELCWGIGSYGDHVYVIQYTIDGLIKNYGDYAGFYHRFLSELSSAPEFASVTIKMNNTNFSADNARIWGYGFTGEVEITNNGTLYAYTTESLDDSDYINLLCRFDTSLFTQAAASDMSFDDLQETAENDNSDTILYIGLIVFAVIVLLVLIVVIYISSHIKLADGTKVKIPGKEQIEVSPSIPFSGSIPSVYYAMRLLKRGIADNQLVSAYLVRWKEKGYIDIKVSESKFHKEESIILSSENLPIYGAEKALYEILCRYADRNGVLTTTDMEDYAEDIHEELQEWDDIITKEGEDALIQSGLAQEYQKDDVRFTVSGFESAVKLLGFEKYLKEMQKYDTDRKDSRTLWGDYFTFAVLFGIGEKVLSSMDAIDHEYYDEFCGSYGFSPMHMMLFCSYTDNFSDSFTTNTDGTGGSASDFGGGGFSGGGGGGSR